MKRRHPPDRLHQAIDTLEVAIEPASALAGASQLFDHVGGQITNDWAKASALRISSRKARRALGTSSRKRGSIG